MKGRQACAASPMMTNLPPECTHDSSSSVSSKDHCNDDSAISSNLSKQVSQMIEIHRFRTVYRIDNSTREKNHDIEVVPEQIADDASIRTSPDIGAGGRY